MAKKIQSITIGNSELEIPGKWVLPSGHIDLITSAIEVYDADFTPYRISLLDKLPDDGYVYEIEISGEMRITSTHGLGAVATIAFKSDIQKSDCRLCTAGKFNQNYDSWGSGTATLLVGDGRYIEFCKSNLWLGQLAYLWMNKYRKLYKA